MKKEIVFSALFIAVALMLTGCSSVNDVLENQIRKKSGIMEDADYLKYEEYYQAGKLNEAGYYSEEVFEEEESSIDELIPSDAVHVSYSANAYLDVQYFSDPEKTTSLNLAHCYLNTGDSIYATVSISKDVASSMYHFSGFRIYEYNGDERELLTTVEPSDDGLVLNVTDDYIGKDISIDPIGDYEERVISLEDSYIDNSDLEHNLSGTWVVNDQEITGDEATINPVSSYVISYQFDGDHYFYLKSDPECYYSNNEDGIVIFTKRESEDETEDYSVTLHEYVSVSIISAETRFVTLNSSRGIIYNGSEQEVKADTALEIPRLKYGDTVTILTDKEWKSLENCRELIFQSLEIIHNPTNKGQTYYKYTMIVPQKGGEFEFNPADYKYDHGTVRFKCFGEPVTSTQYLAKGTRIIFEEDSAEKGYWLPDDNNVIVVGNEEETRKQLESIHFIQKIKVSVTLNKPEYGGSIHYFVDGKEITENPFMTDSGTIISMKFDPWEGWISKYKNDETYTVLENSSQTLTINGKAVSNAFKEDPNHKPTLEVVLDKSVGENMEFEFSASGLLENDYHYEDGWFRNNYMVIDPKKVSIGTEKGITISMGNRAIPSGKAVKILIEKEGNNKSDSSRNYRLVTDLNELQDPILIYDEEERGKSKTWYKSIKLTISVVDVMTYEAPIALDHATITVRNAGTSSDLKGGDIIEGSQQVTMMIIPDSGYYVTGKDVKNGEYKKSMNFAKYQSSAQDIINNHPIEKYFRITLDEDDEYGTCKYIIGKNAVAGTILVKKGQDITLEYKITTEGYKIDGVSGFLGSAIGKNDQEITEKIKVTVDMDKKTLNRKTFGINVVKGAKK